MSENHRSHLLLISCVAMIFLSSNLLTNGLSGYDDAFYAHEGRQMVVTGDWWNVRFNGNLNFEYPPLFIWLQAASFSIFGISDFAAKLPSSVFAMMTYILVFLLAKELSENFLLPVVSTWVLISSLYFMKFAMRGMTDVPFVSFFTLAVFFYIRGFRKNKYFICCGLAVALGILTRSVIGLISLGVIFSHLILTKQIYIFRLSQFWVGILLAFGIPAVWFVSQYQIHGTEFVSGHFAFVMGKVGPGESLEISAILRGFLDYPWLLIKRYEPWFWVNANRIGNSH